MYPYVRISLLKVNKFLELVDAEYVEHLTLGSESVGLIIG